MSRQALLAPGPIKLWEYWGRSVSMGEARASLRNAGGWHQTWVRRRVSRKVPRRRWLIVVADDQPTIHQGLRVTFMDDPTVEVVLDRRGAEPLVQAGEATSERRHPLSPEENVVWRDLKFFLVDRWKGMTVYEAGTVQRAS